MGAWFTKSELTHPSAFLAAVARDSGLRADLRARPSSHVAGARGAFIVGSGSGVDEQARSQRGPRTLPTRAASVAANAIMSAVVLRRRRPRPSATWPFLPLRATRCHAGS